MYNEIIRLMTTHRQELDRWINSPALQSDVELLQSVAAGQYGANGCGDNHSVYDDVSMALDTVIAALFRCSWNSEGIPNEFWQTDMGRTIQRVQLWLECDELITLSEAATILRGGTSKADLMTVRRMIDRGQLVEFTDPNEVNPTHAKRVRRSEVEVLK